MIYDLVEKKCVDCPADKPKFDGMKCVACVLPKYWNATQEDCVECTGGRVYNPARGECICKDSQTFFDGDTCIECFHPKYFNFETLECTSCPDNQIYDIMQKMCVNCPLERPVFDGEKCVTCADGEFWNVTEQKCGSCSGGQVYNKNLTVCECPAGRFWNDITCIECYIPYYFDYDVKKCLSCPVNMVYDLKLRKCVQCPPETPFFDGLKCSACPDPQYWS